MLSALNGNGLGSCDRRDLPNCSSRRRSDRGTRSLSAIRMGYLFMPFDRRKSPQ
jgi:hypothetical protein